MTFDTAQFVAKIANLQGIELLQYIGQRLYLISFVLLFIIPFFIEFLTFTIASKGGRIKMSTIIVTLVVSNAIRVGLMVLIIFGVLPFYFSRI